MTSPVLAIFFFLLCICSLFLLYRTTKNSLQLIERIDDLEEQLAVAVDTLRERHKRLEAKSKTEVFFDDPVVRDVVRDIADCRDILSKIIENFDDNQSTSQKDKL